MLLVILLIAMLAFVTLGFVGVPDTDKEKLSAKMGEYFCRVAGPIERPDEVSERTFDTSQLCCVRSGLIGSPHRRRCIQ